MVIQISHFNVPLTYFVLSKIPVLNLKLAILYDREFTSEWLPFSLTTFYMSIVAT